MTITSGRRTETSHFCSRAKTSSTSLQNARFNQMYCFWNKCSTIKEVIDTPNEQSQRLFGLMSKLFYFERKKLNIFVFENSHTLQNWSAHVIRTYVAENTSFNSPFLPCSGSIWQPSAWEANAYRALCRLSPLTKNYGIESNFKVGFLQTGKSYPSTVSSNIN